MLIGFAMASCAHHFVIVHLALSASSVVDRGRIWQLLTYPFVTGSVQKLIFTGALVLFIGSLIERELHTVTFLIFWLVVSVICGLLWVAGNLAAGNNLAGLGAVALAYGLVGAFALLFRRRRVQLLFWTVEAQYLALFFIAIGILFGTRHWTMWLWICSGTVSGAAVAHMLGRTGSRHHMA